jgi:tetratricopeptide (TPR) repeat protein
MLTHTWILSIAFLFFIFGPMNGQSSSLPMAVLSDVHGNVFLKRSQMDRAMKAVFGMQLEQGDQISTQKEARATVLFSNGNLINLGANSNITISGNSSGDNARNVGAGLAGNFSNLAMRQDSRGEVGVLIDLRSDETAQLIIPLTPCNTRICDTRPTLSWESTRPADEYVVRLYSSQGLVWEARTKENSLKFPSDKEPLEYGASYFWNVEGEDLIHTFRSLNQKFTVLEEKEIEKMKLEEAHIRTLFEDDPENSSCHSLLGTFYSNLGLYEDAIREFELVRDANPEATLPHEILGSLYSDVGKKDLAIAELQKALALEKEK